VLRDQTFPPLVNALPWVKPQLIWADDPLL